MRALIILAFVHIALFSGAQEEEHQNGTAVIPSSNGIEETKSMVNRSLSTVSVFPNPSEGEVFISGEQGTIVTVYTISGTYIGQWIVGVEGKIALSDLGVGMYAVSVAEGAERTLLKFVIL